MQTVKELLTDARDLISDPSKWTKGAMARNKDGKLTSPTDEESVSYCAIGALVVCRPIEPYFTTYHKAVRILNRIAKGRSGDKTIDRFNDSAHRQHWEILKVFDQAIESS